MMKLFLIRHGQTEWNRLGKYQGQADIALSEDGLRQVLGRLELGGAGLVDVAGVGGLEGLTDAEHTVQLHVRLVIDRVAHGLR